MKALIYPAPTLDTIIRVRLRDLIRRAGASPSGIARVLGASPSTLLRKLNTDTEAEDWRALKVSDIDDVLGALGLESDAVFQPALLDGDRDCLRWVALHTPADPLPSRASVLLWRHDDDGKPADPRDDRLRRLHRQGLLEVRGNVGSEGLEADVVDAHIRLTAAGQRALLQ